MEVVKDREGGPVCTEGRGDTVRFTTWDGTCNTVCRLEMAECGGSANRMQMDTLLGTATSSFTALCGTKRSKDVYFTCVHSRSTLNN